MKNVFCDGACEPRNPGGYACYGWLALDRDGHLLEQHYGCIARGAGATNNRAEYAAIIAALRHASVRDWARVTILTDSLLVVNQVTGRWQCHSEHLLPLWQEAQRLLHGVQGRIDWVPRAQNVRADALSRRAYREAQSGRLPIVPLLLEDTEVA